MASMRTKYLDAVALFCALAYALALGIATYRLGVTVSERQATAEREFAELVDRASSAAVLGFMDLPFRETVRDAVRSSRALAAAVVTGPGGPEYAVERSPGYIVSQEGAPRFAAAFGASGQPLFSPLRSGGVRNATVSATALLVGRVEFFVILRDTLIGIAVITMLASLLLILDILKPVSIVEGAVEPAQTQPAPEDPEGSAFDIAIPDLADDIKAEIAESVGTDKEPESTRSDGERTDHTAAPPSGDKPSGLYSPRGDIGWEAYTADRLASELHRCASFEQDLVLLMMKPKTDGALWEAAFTEFAESTVSFFTFRDLVFELGSQGVSVILPNVNLEHGLRMADEFRAKLRKGPTPTIAGADLRIGLTARSGRLVDSERLMLEASRALSKAIEEETAPVVAFKSDPDRYRSFIAGRS